METAPGTNLKLPLWRDHAPHIPHPNLESPPHLNDPISPLRSSYLQSQESLTAAKSTPRNPGIDSQAALFIVRCADGTDNFPTPLCPAWRIQCGTKEALDPTSTCWPPSSPQAQQSQARASASVQGLQSLPRRCRPGSRDRTATAPAETGQPCDDVVRKSHGPTEGSQLTREVGVVGHSCRLMPASWLSDSVFGFLDLASFDFARFQRAALNPWRLS